MLSLGLAAMLLTGRGAGAGCFPHGYADGEWLPTTSAPSYTFSDLPPALTSTRLSSEAYGICRWSVSAGVSVSVPAGESVGRVRVPALLRLQEVVRCAIAHASHAYGIWR